MLWGSALFDVLRCIQDELLRFAGERLVVGRDSSMWLVKINGLAWVDSILAVTSARGSLIQL